MLNGAGRDAVGRRGLLSGAFGTGRKPGGAPRWTAACDVVVVGSGVAGSVAALAAANAGAGVVLLEKAGQPGGTSARSPGIYWIPNNPVLRARRLADPRDDFLRYVARCSVPAFYDPDATDLGVGAASLDLLRAFYDHGSIMVEELGRLAGIESVLPGADDRGLYDHFSDAPENKRPWGRSLVARASAGEEGGADLIARLGTALAARGIRPLCNHPVAAVVRDGGRVIGVTVGAPGAATAIRARKGVIFATGGYVHDPIKRDRLHVAPVYGSWAAGSSTGDFVAIASACGAGLGNLNCAWRAPGVLRHTLAEASLPGSPSILPADGGLLVNATGRRFLNEKTPGHDQARAMYRWDANDGNYPNGVGVYVYDDRAARQFAGAYPIPGPRDEPADWIVRGSTLAELAGKVARELQALSGHVGGLELHRDFADNLAATVARFNQAAAVGRDDEFHRGGSEAERHEQASVINRRAEQRTGIPIRPGANICMRPIAEHGPYYATLMVPCVLDTNGGPVINASAQVIDNGGRPIAGLYAAGNCAASPARDAHWGPGASLGLAMTFAMIAGRAAASAEPA